MTYTQTTTIFKWVVLTMWAILAVAGALYMDCVVLVP